MLGRHIYALIRTIALCDRRARSCLWNLWTPRAYSRKTIRKLIYKEIRPTLPPRSTHHPAERAFAGIRELRSADAARWHSRSPGNASRSQWRASEDGHGVRRSARSNDGRASSRRRGYHRRAALLPRATKCVVRVLTVTYKRFLLAASSTRPKFRAIIVLATKLSSKTATPAPSSRRKCNISF